MTNTATQAVEAANAELYAAFEAGDIDRMSALWADSDDVACIHPGGPILRGRSVVLRSWSIIMANTSYIQFFLTDLEIGIAGDVAVVTCSENILTAGAEDEDAGSFTHPGRVVATNVFQRVGDRWRLLLHHGSPVISPADVSDE
ncbi:MAG: nuclear transport factor 2 family protein [Actinomycetes bacterium]